MVNIRASLRPVAALSALFLCGATLAADYQNHSATESALTIRSDEGLVRITAVGDSAFEVFYQPEGVKQLPSYAIDKDARPVALNLEVSEDALTLHNGDLTARVQKSPLRIRYFRHGEPLFEEEQGLFVHDTLRGFRFKIDDNEKLMGGGQRVLGMDRRGHRMPLYNRAHYGYTTESNQMYYGLSAVMSSDKYVLAFDNSATGHLDLGHTEKDILQFEAVGGRTSYLVMAGDSYPELIEHFTAVTGHQPMPPRWALGNYASRFGYHTEQEARSVVQKFREDEIPLDAIVLDLFWFGKDVKGMMGNLDWDRQAFPTPEEMIADLDNDGVKTILITEPFVLTTSNKWNEAVEAGALAESLAGEPKTFDFYFGNTGLIDVFDEGGQKWFWQTYDRLLDQGVGGWWGDLGEPEVHPHDTIHTLADGRTATADEVHNAYGHKWAELVFTKHRQARPNERPFVMMRSGFIGSQRFGMIPWTGDVSRSWGGLKPQVELSLQMGLLGLGYTHSDLGGFAGGEQFDSEMYTRWLQYGVFQPVYRPHAQELIPPEPVFHDQQTKDIVREFINLRYRLLPYNYTLSYLNSQTGLPLMRPLFFEDESNSSLIDNKSSYLWGDAFLVTPVTEAGAETVSVHLPEGVWFDYWTDKVYQGGQTVELPTSLETLPVLVRAGSFVPMADLVQSTQAYSSEHLTLHYYAHPEVSSAKGLMYDDDGETFDAVSSEQYELLHFSAEQDGAVLTLNLDRQAYDYQGMPESRQLTLVIHHQTQPPKEVKVGKDLLKVSGMPTLDKGQYHYDAKQQRLVIRLHWQQAQQQIEIH
ncbi:Oligosaccharide 4-alpha-D-glucosyltransferase [Saliniradius amylolyticus]|uniref:Oligosaccharide 4-alpha-D-glucosyltransferase n=1 Tax=Saliniradius amylolyticus TaxID=2183582 RepID=A0A2S2E097_9ALTE|nr:TIM-barrel domain-containing protein [Saliniradius amylolyticus]AWL11071.1 Oligosaccharide 4-alpha-D-glucosyltransferase [Saliniradius amylolyticus]